MLVYQVCIFITSIEYSVLNEQVYDWEEGNLFYLLHY